MSVRTRPTGVAACAEELEWVDPPAPDPRSQASVMLPVIDALRARPGEWAIVGRYPRQTTATGVADKFKHRGCEATTRGGVIYARWPEETA